MPLDHPDGTKPIVISRADIKTPIDYQKQTVAVYPPAPWAALKGTDKNFHIANVTKLPFANSSVPYTVPAGRTLYITHLSGGIHAAEAMDSGKCFFLNLTLEDDTEGEYYGDIGGNGGCGIDFSKPMVFPAAHKMILWAANQNLEKAILYAHASGFEVID